MEGPARVREGLNVRTHWSAARKRWAAPTTWAVDQTADTSTQRRDWSAATQHAGQPLRQGEPVTDRIGRQGCLVADDCHQHRMVAATIKPFREQGGVRPLIPSHSLN